MGTQAFKKRRINEYMPIASDEGIGKGAVQ